MLLKFYIELNRQAPIPAPDRGKVKELYREYDLNHNRKISRDEFTALANLAAARAAARVVAFKSFTLVVAPVTAHAVLQYVQKHHGQTLSAWANESLPERMLPVVTNPDVWKTALIVLFVSQLGKTVLSTVDWFLDNASSRKS
jgi:hypothetical protein